MLNMNAVRAYQQAEQEFLVDGSDPYRLVQILFTELLASMDRTALSLEANDLAGKSAASSKALTIVYVLSTSLDFERGGEVAQSLSAFYAWVRGQLLARLDLFGIANAVAALRNGADRAAVRTALRRVSGVDAVCAEIDRAAAPVRYRRIESVLTELTGMAAGPGGARLAEFLAGDDVVLARMAAAAEVLGAAGMPVSRAADSLRMAIGWQRYAEGPVSELHRSCGLDLTRGALRLWDRREPKR